MNIPSGNTRILKFGIISDTHYGSKAATVDLINHFVNSAYNEGVRRIIHGGDITTGNSVYKGQVSELSHWGCHAQCLEVCKNLPTKPDLKYFAILGNHDMNFVKEAGVDPGLILEDMRSDIKIFGHIKGRIILQPGDISIEVIHIKSNAHARSYALEKHLSKSIYKGSLPHMVLAGHLHRAGYFPMNGVHCFMLPCFEDENLFVKYHDFVPEVGGIIVTLELTEDNQIISCFPKFMFYNTRKDEVFNVTI
jgi:predicted phosphodiesterase